MVGRVTSVGAVEQFLGGKTVGLKSGRYVVIVASDKGREPHKVVVP